MWALRVEVDVYVSVEDGEAVVDVAVVAVFVVDVVELVILHSDSRM